MYKAGLLIIGVLWMGCDSTHKLTGTDYVDIEKERPPEMPEDYPEAIIEEVGWSDITTKLKENEENEEFRIWLRSSVYPAHIFKLKKGKKDVHGEGILYWHIDTTASGAGITNLKMQNHLLGTCTEFFTVEKYGYCIPEYSDDINWSSIYNAIESQGFWKLQGDGERAQEIETSEAPDKNWLMFVQMRLGNYYRAYTHQNPETYADAMLRKDVIELSKAVKLIKGQFKQNVSTTTFEGVTNGERFTLCDSSEVWELRGEINRLLERSGLKTTIDTGSGEALYYVVIKGRVNSIWHHDWAAGEFDRIITPNEIYNIRAVNEIKCPEEITGF